MTNLVVTIYIGRSRPFKLAFLNRVEMMNELMIAYTCHSTTLFTDFVSNVRDRYTCGWMMVVLFYAMFGANTSIVVWDMLRNLYLRIKKLCKQIKHNVEKLFFD